MPAEVSLPLDYKLSAETQATWAAASAQATTGYAHRIATEMHERGKARALFPADDPACWALFEGFVEKGFAAYYDDYHLISQIVAGVMIHHPRNNITAMMEDFYQTGTAGTMGAKSYSMWHGSMWQYIYEAGTVDWDLVASALCPAPEEGRDHNYYWQCMHGVGHGALMLAGAEGWTLCSTQLVPKSKLVSNLGTLGSSWSNFWKAAFPWPMFVAVSYTHLTLPTIYSV